jgi:hypothetical protein
MLAGAALVLLLVAIPALAQILYGSLTGVITDKTGALVPNAAITLTNQNTGSVRTTTANGVGSYSFLDVLPGVYTIWVAPTQNFGASSQNNIQIEPNRQVRSDIELTPGGTSTQVVVTQAPPELQTETAEVNSEISKEELNQLPVNSTGGRNFEALYTLIPGGTAVAEQNSTASNPSRAMSVNVNGADNPGNTTRIDGAVNYYGWLPYLIAYVPPADSIENVSITTNSFDAEQGQAGGASIKITTKSGTSNFHGGAWEYYQDAGLNARGYLNTKAASISKANPTGSIPKNVFDEFGFNIGGPVYIPKIVTGKKKLFFFDNFERTTRRQLITNASMTLPDANMAAGNFSEAAPYATIYDPAPSAAWVSSFTPTTACPALAYTAGYLIPACRPSFTQEYGEAGDSVNTIPTARIAFASATMIANLAKYTQQIGTPSATTLKSFMANDYIGVATLAHNRNTNDAKITYVPNDNTQIFGKYSVEPFSVVDPQVLQPAGGGTADGGQPGAAAGRIQNVGLGASHVLTPHLVLDADFGYTRQYSGVSDATDIGYGDYGSDTLKIPGTNGVGNLYAGQPPFFMNGFSALGNTGLANPFLFRDNQFTGDVNLSWIKGKHSTKYGFTVYHFLLNHFQPTSGGGVTSVRGGFEFFGGMTCGSGCGVTAYNSLADFLLGLPNNSGSSQAVAKATSIFNPNSMRWWEYGAYVQDQWTVTNKLTINYGVRYEMYPAPYRDHTGIFIADPNLPQTGNVEIGGVGGNPESAGLNMGNGFYAPRLGVIYRLDEKTVIRSGSGLTTDPDSLRFLRDTYPIDLAPSYVSATGTGSIAVDPANTTNYAIGQPMTLTYGIPAAVIPNYSTGFASLPIAGSTSTAPKNFRRGYLESWNLFVQRDLGAKFVANVGYVGNHMVRQQAGVSPYNSAPLPSGSTNCMANGQWNPSTGLTGSCSFQVNTIFSQKWCNGTSNCYNSGGMTILGPVFSSMYSALQTQLSRNAGQNGSFGVIYTWSHAFDYADNGAGTGGGGTTFNNPAYYHMNKADAGYDRKHNAQIWGIYNLPFGHGQKFANTGVLSQIVGGFVLNGQFSHTSGAPFSVSSNSNSLGSLAPGFGATYAQLNGKYQQLSGHNRVFGGSPISGGRPWFNPAGFASVTEPTYTASMTPSQVPAPVLPNTGRNEFRGPGNSVFNASVFRSIHLYRESNFQIRIEAFNVLNHPLLNNPNTTVPSAANVAAGNYGTFGLITSYGNTRSLQFGGRFSF